MNKANESLRYTLNPDFESYSVSGMGTCTDKDVVIPSTYLGKPVTPYRNYHTGRSDGYRFLDLRWLQGTD